MEGDLPAKSHWTCCRRLFTPSAPQELLYCLFSQNSPPDKLVNSPNSSAFQCPPTPTFFFLNLSFLNSACLNLDRGMLSCCYCIKTRVLWPEWHEVMEQFEVSMKEIVTKCKSKVVGVPFIFCMNIVKSSAVVEHADSARAKEKVQSKNLHWKHRLQRFVLDKSWQLMLLQFNLWFSLAWLRGHNINLCCSLKFLKRLVCFCWEDIIKIRLNVHLKLEKILSLLCNAMLETYFNVQRPQFGPASWKLDISHCYTVDMLMPTPFSLPQPLPYLEGIIRQRF